MKKIFLIFIVIITTFACYCQNTFVKKYHDSTWNYFRIVDIKNTLDKGIIAFGFKSYNDSIMILLKMDSIGNIQWVKKYTTYLPYNLDGSPYYQNPGSIIQLNDSGFVILFNMTDGSIGYNKYGLLKLDKNGMIEWAKYNSYVGANACNAICKTNDDGFATTGGGCSGHNYIIKYNSIGNIIWQKQYSIFGTSGYSMSIIQSVSGDLIMLSRLREGTTDNWDIGLFRIDISGTLKWSKLYGSSDWEEPKQLIEMLDGSIMACGNTRGYSGNINIWDPFIMRTDSSGKLLWFKLFQFGDMVDLKSIINTPTNQCVAVGSSYNQNPNKGTLTLKIDTAGNIMWLRINNIGGCSIINSYDTGFYISGDVLAKIDNDGTGYCQFDPTIPQQLNVLNQLADTAVSVSTTPFAMDTVSFWENSIFCSPYILCLNASVSNENFDSENIPLYPNPSSDFISISYKPQTKNPQFEIIDVMGRKVSNPDLSSGHGFQSPISASQKQIDISKLPQGVYLLKVTDGDMYSVKRFVKK